MRRHDDEGTPDARLDRRAFLGAASAGAAAVALGGAQGASAAAGRVSVGAASGTPGERAIAGIKALNLPAGTSITVFSEDLSILGPVITQSRFEEQSGVKLNIQKAPFLQYAAKVFNDATTKAGGFDVVVMETNRMGDLDNAGYLEDLTAWVKKYNPGLNDVVAPQGRVWPQYNGKYVGLPTDGDVFIFYYRKDLLESPKERKAFRAKYGHELRVPKTYDEYGRVLEFFTRPNQKLWGAAEWRVKGVNYWWFWQRLFSAGGTYFHSDMKPAINGPAGVRALTDMKAMNKFMPPDVLSYGYVETVAAMQNGRVFSNITWPAAGKNVADPKTSKTAGKWGYATVPGYVVHGKINARSMAAPGYNVIVNKQSKANKELCYLYCQWYTSPENLILADTNLKGNTDVVRVSVFNDPRMAKAFKGADKYLNAQKANLAQAVPDPIMPGYTEYTQALEIEISEFMTGKKSATAALDAAAKKWESITNGFDRNKQREIWLNFLKAYKGS
jgi:multiple sugar transport system substrate-binding protein